MCTSCLRLCSMILPIFWANYMSFRKASISAFFGLRAANFGLIGQFGGFHLAVPLIGSSKFGLIGMLSIFYCCWKRIDERGHGLLHYPYAKINSKALSTVFLPMWPLGVLIYLIFTFQHLDCFVLTTAQFLPRPLRCTPGYIDCGFSTVQFAKLTMNCVSNATWRSVFQQLF